MPVREVGLGREEPHSTCCFSVMFEDLALLSVLNRTCISRQASPTAAGASSKRTLVGVGRAEVSLQVVTEVKVGYQVVSRTYGAPIPNFTSAFFCTVAYNFILLYKTVLFHISLCLSLAVSHPRPVLCLRLS